MTMRVKICGLRTAAEVAAAADAGARDIGLNFFAKSPRYVSIAEARDLVLDLPLGVARVALTVDADDAFFDALNASVPLDMLQLHGHESPARVAELRARYGLPVMKALSVADAGDLDAITEYETVADQILVDAKAPKGSALPGGNGLPFDWGLIAGRRWSRPWMLAGGLTPENVAEAVRRTGAMQVDVSSGVESAPGIKDTDKIARFISAAEGRSQPRHD